LNYSNYIVIDFETDGTNPETCQPIQIAAIVLNPRNLEQYPGAEFNSYIRPDFKSLDVTALEINKIKKEDLEEAPTPKIVWKSFCKFVSQYDVIYDDEKYKPVPVGYNLNYDLTIANRLNKLYGKDIFSIFSLDVMYMVYMWFESSNQLKSLRLDSVREKFKIPSKGAHDALRDVKDTAIILRKFLNLHREMNKRDIKW